MKYVFVLAANLICFEMFYLVGAAHGEKSVEIPKPPAVVWAEGLCFQCGEEVTCINWQCLEDGTGCTPVQAMPD